MLATTKVYGCIAHPIDHVKAPTLFTSIFNKKKLCLNPKISLTQNIGIGKKSTNTNKIEKIFNTRLKNEKIFKLKFPDEIKENLIAFNLIKKEFYKNKNISFLKKLFFYK